MHLSHYYILTNKQNHTDWVSANIVAPGNLLQQAKKQVAASENWYMPSVDEFPLGQINLCWFDFTQTHTDNVKY